MQLRRANGHHFMPLLCGNFIISEFSWSLFVGFCLYFKTVHFCRNLIKKGRTNTIKLLIDKGADVDAKDFSEETPLHWASDFGKSFDTH